MIANLRLILDVEVQAGNQSASSYSVPGLWSLLDSIPQEHRPAFIRGDCDWGNDAVMTEAEQRDMNYLFKLRQSKYVKKLILQSHCKPGWERTHAGWETFSSELKAEPTWKQTRRVGLVRRRIQNDIVIAPDTNKSFTAAALTD